MAKPISNPHDCPHPDCHEQIPPHKLACRPHWWMLPKPLRDRITHTYKRNRLAHAHAVREAYAWFKANNAEGGVPV